MILKKGTKTLTTNNPQISENLGKIISNYILEKYLMTEVALMQKGNETPLGIVTNNEDFNILRTK